MAKERIEGNEEEHVAIRLVSPSEGDGPQYSLPTTTHLAALVVGPLDLDAPTRDIIIDNKKTGLERISCLHPAFMSLQYPLLFPYAERGFHLEIPYLPTETDKNTTRKTLTMQEYYCFVCHHRPSQTNPYLCYGLLSSQAVVDSRASIDEGRLWFVLNNQKKLRSENLQGIIDAVGQGFVDGADIGKSIVLPSSHTGGRRYFQENFQDALAIARVHGAPDLFSTFTCNPKWPEITEALLLEPGQRPHDRADIIVRVYNLKLNECLDDIKSGRAYGPIKAVLHTVEFQKRGLPHAHILIWLDRPDTEMPVNELSELVQGNREWTVHVYVSRLWQHRGAIDDGPIKHTDIVFQDAQGNHMYAEIAGTLVKDFIPRIKEGRIYEIKRFLVSPRKNWYMPMEGDSMIRFGKYITVREINANLMDYPLCTYDLTPIDDLPSPTDNPQTFTDVIGVITGVSATAQYHSASRSAPSIKRVVYLSDLSGYEISVVLWGERATTFDGEDVLQSAKDGPVIAIFVGTLVKPFEGRRGLSGGAPCRWYINEDLPEINELRNQLQGKVPAVRGVLLPGQTDAEISAQVDLEIKTIKELINLNIWDHKKTKFYCDVVISRLSPGERWWFHACTSCNKGTIPYGAAYKCSSKTCGGTSGSPRYRICYIGSDGVDDIELVFFDKAGKELIGKPVLTILRSKVPNGMSVEDAIQFARTDKSTPRELASIVSRKYRLVVSVTTKSFEPESASPSYQVHRIQADHGKRARSSESSALGRRPGLALASPSSSACSSGLSPAGETLASQLILVEENSLTGLSDGSGSVGIVASTVGSGNTLTQTPPSVAKPPKTSDSKDGGDTSVKKSLFSETSSGSDIVVLPELDSQVQREEPAVLMTDDLETMAEPPVDASTEKSSTKRRQKTKQEPASKKNKL